MKPEAEWSFLSATGEQNAPEPFKTWPNSSAIGPNWRIYVRNGSIYEIGSTKFEFPIFSIQQIFPRIGRALPVAPQKVESID